LRSPNPFDAILIEQVVTAHQLHGISQRLRDHQPIEGITVMEW
jgi:hypothetical protein